jgi:hypothetical protein
LFAVLLGLFFIAGSVFFFSRTAKADAAREKLMKKVSPENPHQGVMLYAKISRHVGSVLMFVFGVLCLLGGLGFFSN